MNWLELEFHWVWLSTAYRCIDRMPPTFVLSPPLSVKPIRWRRIPRDHRCMRRLRLQAERPGSDEVGWGVWAQLLLPAAAADQANVDSETENQVTVQTDYTLCPFTTLKSDLGSEQLDQTPPPSRPSRDVVVGCIMENGTTFCSDYWLLLLPLYLSKVALCIYMSDAESTIRSSHNVLDQRFWTDRTWPKRGLDWVVAERKCLSIM